MEDGTLLNYSLTHCKEMLSHFKRQQYFGPCFEFKTRESDIAASIACSGVHREIVLMPQSLGIDTSLRLWWNSARSIIDSGLSAHRNFDHITSCTAHKCGRMIQLLFCPRVTLPPLSSWAPVFVTYPSAQSGLISQRDWWSFKLFKWIIAH